MIAIYSGSFDPLTNGHMDIIQRASAIFSKLIVGILVNTSKKEFFPLADRLALLENETKKLTNVNVKAFSGLLVDFAAENHADIVVRGLRSASDFDYEWQIARANRVMKKDLETLFLPAGSEYAYISASLVREIASFGGNIGEMVPDSVRQAVWNRIREKNENHISIQAH